MATLNIKGFPDGLHRRLKARAKRNRRSVSQEVTHLLNESVEAAKVPSLLGLRDSSTTQTEPPETPAEVAPHSITLDEP